MSSATLVRANKRDRPPQLQPPRITHLGWLYLLALGPILSSYAANGRLPESPREYVSDIVMMVIVFAVVNMTIRRSKALGQAMRAQIRVNELLQHANRLATVGQLAAGVAHELGSPLQVVAGRAKMVVLGEDPPESGRIILEQAQRMTRIIRGLLGFARRQPARRSITDVEAIALEVHRMVAPIAHGRSVALKLDVAGATPVCVDALQIQQALTNLVMNAVQAVPRGGHVGIVVDRIRSSLPPDHSGLWLSPPAESAGTKGDCTCLRVVDDGPGIEEDAKSRVFEPFYTTKDVGEGTGLGLAVAHGLVRENGGWITVDSELGHGTCFSICFPSAEGPN